MPRLKLFLLAIGFYTRLPTPRGLDYNQLPKASLYLPLVGWLIGAITGACFYLSDLIWSQATATLLALIAGIFLTGAFHEDGFADVCDGFGGGYDKQRILEIMKDSQIGSYGALGLIMIIATKMSVLSVLPASTVTLLLFAGHSLSRFLPLILMYSYDYARIDDSKSNLAVCKPSLSELIVAGFIALLPLLLLPLPYMLTVPIIMLVNWRLGAFFCRQIGGYTGDCLGASQQVAETVFYLCIGAIWTFI